jgi:hypothetical protein
MKTPLLLTLAILLFPAIAHAQVAIRFGWTAPPPVVEVSPGVQVVEDSGDEVFFTNGHYWVERDGRWYWANDYREHWVPARGAVPVFLRNHHRGEYAHWRRADHAELRREEREVRHDDRVRAEERREVRHDERVREENREIRHDERVRAEERHEIRAEERHDQRVKAAEEHREIKREERREERHE